MKNRIGKDELAIIIMVMVTAIIIISIRLFSAGKNKRTADSTTTYGVQKETSSEVIFEVAGDVDEETEEITTEAFKEIVTTEMATTKAKATTKYQVVENITDKVVKYDKAEDPLANRKTTAATKATTKATTKAQTTTKGEEKTSSVKTTFTLYAPAYDANGNVLYSVKSCDEVMDSELAKKYLENETTLVVVSNKTSMKLKGYAVEYRNVGSHNTKVVSKFLVPVEKEIIQETEKDIEIATTATTTTTTTTAIVTTKETVTQQEETSIKSDIETVTTVKNQEMKSDTILRGAVGTETVTTSATEISTEVSKETTPTDETITDNTTKQSDEETKTVNTTTSELTESERESTDDNASSNEPVQSEKVVEYRVYELEVSMNTTTMNTLTDGWYNDGKDKYYYYNADNMAKGYADIAGVKCYFDSEGRLSSKRGIDISQWNGDIDWAAVKASGIDFVIIRACGRGYTSGELYADKMFAQNVTGAQKAGLEVGAYIFSQAINEQEAVEEASLIITMCKQYKIMGPLVIDVEEVSDKSARQNQITKEVRTDIIKVFGQVVSENGYTPMLYTGASWYRDCIDYEALGNIKRWIAKWNENPPEMSYEIWQYSDLGSVTGINGAVDLNIWIEK